MSGIRFLGDRSFGLAEGNEVFVTNKYEILSGPREWLDPVGLGPLRTAMGRAEDESAQNLYVSSDTPDRFDSKYPNHILNVHLILAPQPSRMTVAIDLERADPDETDEDLRTEIERLLSGVLTRHSGSNLQITRDDNQTEYISVMFDIPVRSKTVGKALSIGEEAEFIVKAATGGHLNLPATVDLIRTGYGAALAGSKEGPWFDGKSAPYQLDQESGKWEFAKDLAAFANSEAGGVILLGARTTRERDGDVVKSVVDIDLDRINIARYRALGRSRIHPQIEGLEMAAVDHGGGFGVGFFYVPPQRDETKPFVVTGAIAKGHVLGTHICIPTRDGEDTRYTDAAEVHSLLQAGRVALRGR